LGEGLLIRDEGRDMRINDLPTQFNAKGIPILVNTNPVNAHSLLELL
jgi:hypothetical protein